VPDSSETSLYVYATGKKHNVNIDGTDYTATFDAATGTFTLTEGAYDPSQEETYDVSISLGANMAASDDSLLSQTGLATAMRAVTITPAEGYVVSEPTIQPADAGIAAQGDAASGWTISGTPTANVTVTFADAEQSSEAVFNLGEDTGIYDQWVAIPVELTSAGEGFNKVTLTITWPARSDGAADYSLCYNGMTYEAPIFDSASEGIVGTIAYPGSRGNKSCDLTIQVENGQIPVGALGDLVIRISSRNMANYTRDTLTVQNAAFYDAEDNELAQSWSASTGIINIDRDATWSVTLPEVEGGTLSLSTDRGQTYTDGPTTVEGIRPWRGYGNPWGGSRQVVQIKWTPDEGNAKVIENWGYRGTNSAVSGSFGTAGEFNMPADDVTVYVEHTTERRFRSMRSARPTARSSSRPASMAIAAPSLR
jgi:hypothetical protein